MRATAIAANISASSVAKQFQRVLLLSALFVTASLNSWAQIVVSPASVTFTTKQIVGTTSTPAKSVTITNNGASAQPINPIVMSGDFTETDNCGSSIPGGGGTCTANIFFAPTLVGAISGAATGDRHGPANESPYLWLEPFRKVTQRYWLTAKPPAYNDLNPTFSSRDRPMGRVFRFAQRVVLHVGGLPWLGISILGVLTLSSALLGQTSPDSEASVPLPTDWSHHHLVFSRPATAEQFIRVQQDPRYWQQLARRTALRPEAEVGDAVADEPDVHVPFPRLKRKLKRDWQQVMNANASVGAGQYPAKYSLSTSTASCSDFVVFNTGLTGSATQANIIAYTNLYTNGCPGTVPQVYWAYNTGGKISTSVTISSDGSQVAFVQTPASGSVQLVVLKWKSSATETASLPMTLSNTAAGSYRACTAPCMTELTYVSGPSEAAPLKDTNSSPYYDYGGGADKDTLYAGDDPGYLHQFTGVFLGTPTETSNATASAGWPSHAASAPLSSPVFDAVSGNVFVMASWQESDNSGGRLHAICVTTTCGALSTTSGTPFANSRVLGPARTGTLNTCNTLSSGNAAGSTMRVDAPLVDSTAKMMYVFMGNDGTGSSAVYQFPTSQASISGSCGTKTTIGTVAPANPDFAVLAGAFDNLYFTSSGSSPTGNLYVCGNTAGVPTLYQIRITSNAVPASGTSVLQVSNANTTCSPVTEIYNAGTDYAFLSVALSSTTTPLSCTAATGCLMSFSLPTTLGGALPGSPTAKQSVVGGTSGLVLDNTVGSGTMKGASQVYFSPLSNQTCNGTAGVGCAVQASQALLL